MESFVSSRRQSFEWVLTVLKGIPAYLLLVPLLSTSGLLIANAHAETKITMTQGQYCKSCTATVEALFEYSEAKAQEKHNLQLEASKVAEEMCNSAPFPYYKEFFKTGCEHIVASNLTLLIEPLMNQDYKLDATTGHGRTATGRGVSSVFKSDTLKFEHMKAFCRNVGACPETFFAMGRDYIKHSCKACHEFVWDFKVVLAREREVTPARVLDVLTGICEKLSTLHLRPGKIEDACESFVENWYEDYLDQGLNDKFLNMVADNIDDIMVGRYDISTPMCSEYINVCSKKSNKGVGKKKTTQKKEKKRNKKATGKKAKYEKKSSKMKFEL